MVLYVGSTCLMFVYERESIVAMIHKRGCVLGEGCRCAVFMRHNGKWQGMMRCWWLMTDDWWLLLMIVNCFVVEKILRKRVNKNEIGRLSVEPCALCFWRHTMCRRPLVSDIRWRIYCRFKRYRTRRSPSATRIDIYYYIYTSLLQLYISTTLT